MEEIQVLYDYCKMLENMEMFEKCITKNNPYIVRTWTGLKFCYQKMFKDL